jgi:hypothetical protein
MCQLLTEAAGILASIGTGLSFWLGHFPVLTSRSEVLTKVAGQERAQN